MANNLLTVTELQHKLCERSKPIVEAFNKLSDDDKANALAELGPVMQTKGTVNNA